MSSSDKKRGSKDVEMTQYPIISYSMTTTSRKRSGSFSATITATGTSFGGTSLGRIGFVKFDHSQTRKDTDIHTLFTESNYRGRGIGTKLMQLAEQEAIRSGSTKMIIPMPAPRAQTLYGRLGYSKVNNHVPTMEKVTTKRKDNKKF